MDPISRATVPNTIPATSRVNATAPLPPVLPVPPSSEAAALAILSSTQVDISPLGQFLSGVALSRRQLLALQGATEEARAANTPVNVNDDLLALARQLTESFAQLQTSGIDASQLATAGDTPGSLAQRYDLLSGDGTTDAAAALAQDGSLLTQAGLARIGIDLRNEDVNPATLQAAYAADSNATLNALQQGTEVLAQVGAVLAQRQGAPVATNVEADLTGEALPSSAAQAPQAEQMQAVDEAPSQTAAIAQRQLELQQQLEAEELNLDLQELRPQPQAQAAADAAQLLQTQRTDNQRVDAQRLDAERINTDQQTQQQEAARVDELRQGQVQQQGLQQQAQAAADDAARAQLAASDAQMAAQAASDRAQSLARAAQGQADAGLATAQAQLAQQNTQAQELAAQAAGRAVPPPSSQDPSVAAAIAAYNLNNAALNPGLMNRPLPASDSRLPLVAPVAPVEPVKPVTKI
ncbi:hypothetical protein [Janthinobacterium lividum]|uniref:hypothetical protein n=1 Tax=Janthinobacterium lividum TaxID=29581 RepID=UPI000873880E|nr:hypothetical protein [Janthinobacterium lividum]MCC7716815.1 hypothetical protein [Janthinobacterium lividum]OEZ64386.1 hypothetical protein JANLI_07120 [Janthinobacterium lividum]WQE30580.1 hypothetical protein U0004_09205 [Janthinobacterium lividum]STQ96076.1 Uncharacterised protein [Janthinobacterium lividum]